MRIIVFGGSIAQGFYDTERGGWANRLFMHVLRAAERVNYKKHHIMFVLGITGETITGLDKRFDAEFNRRCKDSDTLTIFSYGGNDSMHDNGACRTPLEEFKTLYAKFIQKAKTVGSVVLVGLGPIDEKQLNPIPWNPARSCLEADRSVFDQAVQELAATYGCLYIPMHDVFGDAVAAMTVDGLHPNAEGHKRMFERIRSALEDAKLL